MHASEMELFIKLNEMSILCLWRGGGTVVSVQACKPRILGLIP